MVLCYGALRLEAAAVFLRDCPPAEWPNDWHANWTLDIVGAFTSCFRLLAVEHYHYHIIESVLVYPGAAFRVAARQTPSHTKLYGQAPSIRTASRKDARFASGAGVGG